ncbi:MAG: aconitase X catalytic domain-containing protein [Candidatus Bathyarchaeia archaeon]
MYLTKEEERVLAGEYGWVNQTCMKILVKLGELFGATKLIPISSAHVSGVSYKTLGDAPVEFLEALADAGGKAKVTATLNPQSFDTEYLRKKLGESLWLKQLSAIKHFEKMGFQQSFTCTPYYLKKPRQNSHLAWAESSAVVYANSVLEAWTNREGGPSALAAAIIGKTPDYGMHKPENRFPTVLVKLKTQLKSEIEFGALGIFLGETLGDKIPAILGLKNASQECLKQLGAALASAGMVNMFHFSEKYAETRKMETIGVEVSDIKRTIENLTTSSEAAPDLVFIGCPHCSLKEVKEVANMLGNRKVKEGIELWVCTSRFVKEKAKRYVEKLEKSGCRVITDTCAVVTWTDKLGIKTIMTNSAKTAHYAPTLNKAETILAPLEKCLNTALKG